MSDEAKKIDELEPRQRLERAAGPRTDAAQVVSGEKQRPQSVAQSEFFKLLVGQLENKNAVARPGDEFALNLAQFSQLENLVAGNKETGEQALLGAPESLAGYLGQEVTLNSNLAEVNNHDGGRVCFTLSQEAKAVQVELLNADGSVKETVVLGALRAGSHSAALSNLRTANGQYPMRVQVEGLSGGAGTTEGYAAGVVTGFVPGSDPALMLGERQVKPADIREVKAVSD